MDYEDFSGSDVSSNTSQATDTGELDVVFFECDTESQGNIPVSRLLHYLREHVGFSEQGQSVELDSLCSILDPDDDDIAIDIDTFRKGVLQWMSQVQDFNENNLNLSCELQDEKCETPTRSLKSRLASFGLTSLDSSKLSLLNTSVNNYIGRDNMMNQSMETTGMASAEHQLEQEIDVGEVLSHVETLKFQNRKLLEENGQLKEQMVTGEDTTTQLSQKLEALQRELKAYQGNQERMQELSQENEDLKVNLEVLTEEKKELRLKIRQMEKNNESLENSKLLLEGEIKSLASELDGLCKVRKDLQTSLSEEKKMRTEVERITEVQETELMEKGVKLHEMEKMMSDLNKVNETLRQEKTDVEMILSHTQHELASMQIKSDHPELDGSSGLEMGTSLCEDVMPVIDLPPTAASTPFKVASLCTEIVVSMHDEPSLPSPLCDKEYEGVVEFNLSEELEDDMESMVKSASNLKRMPAKIAQVAGKLKQRNEIIIQQIDQLVSRPRLQFDSPVKPSELIAKPGVVRSILQKELQEYTDKIETLAKAKTTAEKRILRLTEMLKNVQEENKVLEEKQRAEIEQLEEDSQEALSRLEGQVEELGTRLDGEREDREQITARNKELGEQATLLQENIKELQTLVSELESGKEDLENDLKELKHANRDLTDQYQQSKDALDRLEDEYEQLTSRKKEEEDKAQQLEDRILAVQLKRQVDWRQLWRLVQTDSELSDDTDHMEDATNESSVLRNHVTQKIEYLKAELIRSQATLRILQTQSPPLKGKLSRTDQHVTSKLNTDLVDALNLDSLISEGSQTSRMKHINHKSLHNSNTLDPYYNHHSNLVRSDSSSCPDLDQLNEEGRLHLPSALRGKDRRQAVKRRERKADDLNTSTSSGTSGIEIGFHSNKAEKMKDNIRGSPETLSAADDTSGDDHYSNKCIRKNQLQAKTSLSSKLSPKAIRDSFNFGSVGRSRTHSFKSAIERGPSGDSGISNPSQDRHDNSTTSLDLLGPKEEDLLPQESDLIKIGLYTNQNRANLKHSTFRSGYYDRETIHVPYSGGWNSPKELSSARGDHFVGEKYSIEQEYSSDQVRGLNNPKEFNQHYFSNGRTQGSQNFDSLGPGIDPRRLSILPEKDEKDESSSNPIPPPRRNRNGKPTKGDISKDLNGTEINSKSDQSGPSHLVAHHVPADKPVKSPRLKKAAPKIPSLSPGREQNSETRCKEVIGKKELTPTFSRPPTYEQVVETRLKEKMGAEVTRNSEKEGTSSSSDALYAYQAVHGVPFHRAPPPYQKPFPQDSTANKKDQEQTSESADCVSMGDGADGGIISVKQSQSNGGKDSESTENLGENTKQTEVSDNIEETVTENCTDERFKDRRVSLEMMHNQPHLGSKDDVHLSLHEVESRLSTLSISSNQIAEQNTEVDNVQNADSENKSCAETAINPEKELSRTLSFDEGGESVKTEAQSSDKANKCGKSDGSLALLKEAEEPSATGASSEDVRNEAENREKDVFGSNPAGHKGDLSSVMEECISKPMEELRDDNVDRSCDRSCDSHTASDSRTIGPVLSLSSDDEKPKTIQAKVFPSLSDKVLAKWGLKRKPGDPLDDPELLTDQQIEERYTNVVLCFKTDKQTLDQRVELHQRARDTTEQNIKHEMDDLHQAMTKLEPFCNDMKSRDIFAKIQKHIELLDVSTDRLACRAETLGAAQQEFRISRAMDMIVKHVENLKHLYDSEHQELEETKRLIQENKVAQGGGDRNGRTVVHGAGGSKFGRRRASVAVVRGMQPLSPLSILSIPSTRNDQTKDDSTVQYANPTTSKADLTSPFSGISSLLSSSCSSMSPVGGTVSCRRRASIAVTSQSPERPSSLLSNIHPSLLAYRTPRYHSLSSTSSEDTIATPDSLTFPGIIEQTAEEDETSAEKSATPVVCETEDTVCKTENKEPKSEVPEASSEPDVQKLPPDKEDANNNNNNNNDKNMSEISSQGQKVKLVSSDHGTDFDGELQLPGGLTDDSKLIMYQAAEQQYENRIRELQQALAEMQHKESEHRQGHWQLGQGGLFERLWSLIPPRDELKLRLRYTVAGMIFFAAFLCLIMTFLPRSDASDRTRYSRHTWTSLEEMIWPYLSVKRSLPPPF